VMPLVLTGFLVVSTVPMTAAVRAARAARRRAAWWLVAIASALQGTYLGLQVNLFVDDYHKFTPSQDAYGSIYFTLLGVHHAHVALGLFQATDGDDLDAAPPGGRTRFMAALGLAIAPIFLAIIVLNGIGAVAQSCAQS